MAKREKIILGLMAAAIVFGLFSLLFSSPQKAVTVGSDNRLKELNEMTGKFRDDLQKEALSPAQAYVLENASVEWNADPFVGKTLVPAAEPAKDQPAPEVGFSYTGFMNSPTRRLAVINGMEYVIGEELQAGGYIVRIIEQDKVVLEVTGKNYFITVPFAGEMLR